MELYLILAISFAIMYYFRYTREIIQTTLEVAELFDDLESTFNIAIYSILTFADSLIFMPLYAYKIIKISRYDYIKERSMHVLKMHFGLEQIKNSN